MALGKKEIQDVLEVMHEAGILSPSFSKAKAKKTSTILWVIMLIIAVSISIGSFIQSYYTTKTEVELMQKEMSDINQKINNVLINVAILNSEEKR